MGGLAEGAAALAPTVGEVAGTLAGAAAVGAAATAGLAVSIAGGAAYSLARGLSAGEHALPAQQGSENAAVQDVPSANGMNDATQPQHFLLRTGSSTCSPEAAAPPLRAFPGAAAPSLTVKVCKIDLERNRVPCADGQAVGRALRGAPLSWSP